jgi:hypothetical protein
MQTERRIEMQKMDVKVIERDGNFIIMNDEFPVKEYTLFKTRDFNIYLHKSYPPVFFQKKWVGKGKHYLGVPGLKNCRVVRSPKGNLVTNAAGMWGPVVNATEEGEYHVLLSPEETLQRGKPMYIICPD